MILPYNAYKYLSAKPDDVLMKGGPNPDVLRWELHRVHVVEATLKPGARHVVAKRRFYIEEDNPDAVMVDAWDATGKLSRGVLNPCAWAYDKQAVIHGGTFYFDFGTGAWYNSSILGGYKGVFIDTDSVDPDAFYSPDGWPAGPSAKMGPPGAPSALPPRGAARWIRGALGRGRWTGAMLVALAGLLFRRRGGA